MINSLFCVIFRFSFLYILPNSPFDKKNIEYALEADLLNKAVFHLKAKEFRKQNQNPNQNLRDIASMNQLLVLTNLEAYNSLLIEKGVSRNQRAVLLTEEASRQLSIFNNQNVLNNHCFAPSRIRTDDVHTEEGL